MTITPTGVTNGWSQLFQMSNTGMCLGRSTPPVFGVCVVCCAALAGAHPSIIRTSVWSIRARSALLNPKGSRQPDHCDSDLHLPSICTSNRLIAALPAPPRTNTVHGMSPSSHSPLNVAPSVGGRSGSVGVMLHQCVWRLFSMTLHRFPCDYSVIGVSSRSWSWSWSPS